MDIGEETSMKLVLKNEFMQLYNDLTEHPWL